MIEGIDLCVHQAGRDILDRVSLALDGGEVLALLGPNGAGKSTLLRALCGDMRLAAGVIRLAGRPLADWAPRECARRRAVLPQHSSLSFPFTVLEVVQMGRTPHGTGPPRDHAIARAALAALGVEDLAQRRYPTLSGGEQQRVQLARVLAQIWDPTAGGHRYLLLDEPTSSLDLEHQHSVLALARRFARDGTGVLVVLHDLNLAAQYADRVALLKHGRVAHIGRPTAILTPETIADVFAVRAVVMSHPGTDVPLVLPLAAMPTEAH